MATLRELKGRIGSVASSEKITGAMKMISSAKMHKAEQALRRLKPYRDNIEAIIANLLSSDATFASPLTEPRGEVRRVSVVVLGSDDGLCGAYNVNISKALSEHIRALDSQYGPATAYRIISVGRKMLKAAARLAADSRIIVEAAPEYISAKSEGDDVKRLAAELQRSYVSGETDRIDIVYMGYISAGRQRVRAEQMLPLRAETFAASGTVSAKPYLFEPDAQTIFSTALPMFLLAQAQDVFCENRASEQAARVMAMQSANDNAKKLLEQLQLEYNKLRQQSITTELLDIVGGQVKQ